MIKNILRRLRDRLFLASLRAAIAEQGLDGLFKSLEVIQPDLRRQYTSAKVESPYLEAKVRGQHAFQISLALPEVAAQPGAVVADIGDSSGTHGAYLAALNPGGGQRFISVNLDPEAVAKAKARGFEAVLARAEDLTRHGINADIFLCLETLEHLSDPMNFLHDLSARTRCRRLILTVPFVRRSRVGLHHIRQGLRKAVSAEDVHCFELAPDDLRLMFRHAGWKIERERVYLQYPRRSWLALTRPLWRRSDFEGFYGAVLSRDDAWSSLYTSWSSGE